MITVEEGSIVEISESQFKALGDKGIAYKEEAKEVEPEEVTEEKPKKATSKKTSKKKKSED